jgi:Zn-dependent peptidase ImmA (M78 family)
MSSIGSLRQSDHPNRGALRGRLVEVSKESRFLIDGLVNAIRKNLLPKGWSALANTEKHAALETLAKTRLIVREIGVCSHGYGLACWSREAGGYKILLNRRKPINEQLFTLAHEIGHILLHLRRYRTALTPDPYAIANFFSALAQLNIRSPDEEEAEAEYFAMVLLQPKIMC